MEPGLAAAGPSLRQGARSEEQGVRSQEKRRKGEKKKEGSERAEEEEMGRLEAYSGKCFPDNVKQEVYQLRIPVAG